MSANLKDSPGQREYQDDRSKKQFVNENANPLIKKVIENRQNDEYLRTSKSSEGLCYWCDEYKYVLPGLVFVCARCMMKRNKDAILAIAKKDVYGYCFFCKQMSKIEFKYNIAQLNVRLCTNCSVRVREATKKLKGGAIKSVDPFWKYARKRLGKDFNAFFEPHKVPRGFWKK